MRTSQELRSNKKEVELYGGGRISEGNADVMELGHSRQFEIEIPISPDSPKNNPIAKQNQAEAGQKLPSSGSGDGIEVFKFGDEDLVSRPTFPEYPEISTEPR